MVVDKLLGVGGGYSFFSFFNKDEKPRSSGSVQSRVCTHLVCATVACTGLDLSHKSFRNMIPSILAALICKTISLSYY